MEQRDGRWTEAVEVTADTPAVLKKRVAAVNRLLRQLEKEREKPPRAQGEGALYKRGDGMWVGRVELPPGPDGKRRRSKPVYSKDRATVVDKLEKLKGVLAQGLDQLDRQLTLQTWLERWLEEIARPKMRPHAWKSYRSAVNTRIVPAIGAKRLADLRAEHVRYMHKWILGSTYERGGKKIPYTTRSVEEAHNVLSAALTDALAEGLVHRNVCESVSKPTVLSESHGALTSEQARSVLIAAMQDGDLLVTRWAAGLMLGGRQGELLGLQWDRVNLDEGTLDLAWQLEWLPLHKGAKPDDPNRFAVPAGFEYIPLWRGAALTRPKTTLSQRMIPLPEPLAAILEVYRKSWTPNPWNLVWVSNRETPISDAADRKGWAAAQKRAKIADPVDVHGMRGTTATLLMEARVPDSIVQAILGHASVLMTRKYQRVDLTMARKALGNLDGLLELS
ncbi:tyrosine-type recombinase/integrase [Nocardia abscessus]|uniref:tyrosine-type recombinase/integrase n=1 Tax=Nocardia abscessus TaxID=120957 RepID=UPI002457D80C|nr:tyrosine-type recombinase/integrase [Nocardia abscessus]